LRRSATWPRFGELKAAFGEKAGWERANWFDANAADGDHRLRPAGWAGQVWSPAIGAEVRATTEAAGLYDQSSFAKFDVRGPDVVSFLQRMCANDIDKVPGTLTYTQLLNRRAGIEADLTVTRLDDTLFRVVTSTASGVRDADWLRRHAPDGVTVDDVTGAYGCLCLWGPAAREILAPVAEAPLDFGFMRARRFSVGGVPVLAQRVTFVGEFGWELYAPTEYMLTLWDTLMLLGTPLGLRPAGYRAMDAMRLEKGYRVWGSDITTDTTPDEAGLSFAVRTDKDFIGRDALRAQQAAGIARKLTGFVMTERGIARHGYPIYSADGGHDVDGAAVGTVTSGGPAPTLEKNIGLGYVPTRLSVPGTKLSIDCRGKRVNAEVVSGPFYKRGKK